MIESLPIRWPQLISLLVHIPLVFDFDFLSNFWRILIFFSSWFHFLLTSSFLLLIVLLYFRSMNLILLTIKCCLGRGLGAGESTVKSSFSMSTLVLRECEKQEKYFFFETVITHKWFNNKLESSLFLNLYYTKYRSNIKK